MDEVNEGSYFGLLSVPLLFGRESKSHLAFLSFHFVIDMNGMGVSDLMEVLSPKLDLMSSVPGSNAWEAASASAFPFPGSSKQESESLPSGPIPSAQATAAKNLYSRPLVGSTSRFQPEPKQDIYPNQLAIKYQPRIPLSLHLNRRFQYLSKIYRFSQLAACRIGKR